MTLETTGTIEMEAKVKYLHKLFRGEALRQFDLVSADAKNTETLLDVDYLLKGLAWFFFVNLLSKQNLAMLRCMKNPRRLKVKRYAVHLVCLNEYLASFPGATMSNKMGITELNGILLNSMPNSWSKQAYVQGFDGETISFLKAVNMFERMEITDIYEGVVSPSYKKIVWSESNHTGLSRNKIVEAILSNTPPAKDESARKRSK